MNINNVFHGCLYDNDLSLSMDAALTKKYQVARSQNGHKKITRQM